MVKLEKFIRYSMTENQKDAFKWWAGLSINEMKNLAKKYYPNFSHYDLYKMSPVWIEDIYNKETKEQEF